MTQPVNVLVIPVDGHAYQSRVQPDLDTMQGLVGGFLQPLPLLGDAVVYLDEEGKFSGAQVNPNANRLVRAAGVGLAPDDVVVGQVVVVGVLDDAGRMDGEEHDVPESVLALCREVGIPLRD